MPHPSDNPAQTSIHHAPVAVALRSFHLREPELAPEAVAHRMFREAFLPDPGSGVLSSLGCCINIQYDWLRKMLLAR